MPHYARDMAVKPQNLRAEEEIANPFRIMV
jgi:hypothetical protein